MILNDLPPLPKSTRLIYQCVTWSCIARMTISYPMQFEIRNEAVDPQPVTHVGVLEFTANEGRCYIPYWIMQNLLVPESGVVTIKNVTLPLATFIKFRPQSVDFLDISNPKAVLESTLRNFSCMTKNDMICLPYNGKNYYLEVTDVQPKDACSIVEADVKVDFEAPVGYEEQTKAKEPQGNISGSAEPSGAFKVKNDDAKDEKTKTTSKEMLAKAAAAREKQLKEQQSTFVAFAGKGARVDGKIKKGDGLEDSKPTAAPARREPKKTKWSSRGGKKWGEGQGKKLGN